MNRRHFASLAAWGLILTAGAPGSPAGVIHWNNPAGGDWGTAANWSPAQVPTSADDVIVDLAGTYTILVTGSRQANSLAVDSGTAVIEVRAISGNHATLTLAAGGTNHGAIRMTSTHISYNSTITVTSGSLTLAAGGQLLIDAGAGGSRTFNGYLRNGGWISVATGPVLPVNGVFEVAGGTHEGDLFVNGSEVRVTASPAVETRVVLRGNCTLATDILPNVVLHNLAVSGAHANLTIPAGVVNHGIIRLDSLHASYQSNATVASGVLTNAPDGRIEARATLASPRGIAGSVTNEGTISIDPAIVLSLTGAGAALHLNAGAVEGGGTLQFSSAGGTCTWSGGTHSTPTVVLNSNLLIPTGSTGAGTVYCRGSSTLAGEILSGQTVHLQAVGGLHSTTTIGADLTNHGTLRMDSTHASYNATLIALTTLTNASGGLFDVVAGAGGQRLFNGHLKNQGSISVAAGVVFPISGVYEVAGGTYSGDCYVNGSEVRVTASPAAPTSVVLRGNCSLTTDNLANVLLNNLAVGGVHASLTLPAGVTNHGTIRLDSAHASYNSTLTIASGALTNAVGGLIEAAATLPSNRSFVGSLTNSGTINVASGLTLGMSGTAAALILNGGDIGGSGVFQLSGNTTTCTWNAGTISGISVLSSSNLIIPIGSTGSGTIRCRGATTLAGAIENGQTVHVESIGGLHASLTIPANLTNHGVIRMDSAHGAYSSTISANAVLTNAPDGLFDVVAGAGGSRTFNGHLRNQGLLTVAPGQSLPMNGIYEVAGGTYAGDAYVNGSEVRVTASPATETSVILRGNCTLTTDNLANVLLVNRSVGGVHANLTTTAATANHGTIRLESSHAAYNSTLITGAGFTNAGDGLIEAVAAVGGGRAITGTFTNAGLLRVNSGVTLSHAGSLTNFSGGTLNGGTFDLAGTYRFSSAAITTLAATLILNGPNSSVLNHTNGQNGLASLATVAGSGSLSLLNQRDLTTTAAAFSNSGLIRLGVGCTLHVLGGFSQSNGATLTLELGGYNAGTGHGRISGTTSATLGGTLSAELANGYMPLLGHRFLVVDFASRSGIFDPFLPPTLAGEIILGTDYRHNRLWLVTTTTLCEDFIPCDSNCDGSANQFDIDPFIISIQNHTTCSPCASDLDGNGTVNTFDINGFLQCLGA